MLPSAFRARHAHGPHSVPAAAMLPVSLAVTTPAPSPLPTPSARQRNGARRLCTSSPPTTHLCCLQTLVCGTARVGFSRRGVGHGKHGGGRGSGLPGRECMVWSRGHDGSSLAGSHKLGLSKLETCFSVLAGFGRLRLSTPGAAGGDAWVCLCVKRLCGLSPRVKINASDGGPAMEVGRRMRPAALAVPAPAIVSSYAHNELTRYSLNASDSLN